MNDEIQVLEQVGIRLVKEKDLMADYPIDTVENVIKFASEILREYDREVLAVISLNTKLRPLNMSICSMGALNAAIAAPRELMKTAILSNASAFVLIHNHPGMSTAPSLKDIQVTDQMSKVGKLLGINMLDHIITAAGKNELYSFFKMDALPDSELSYAEVVSDIKLYYRDELKKDKVNKKQLCL